MADEPTTRDSAADAPQVASATTLARAVPSFAVLIIADVAAVWAAVSGSWAALVVVVVCVIDGLADGVFAWLRARASFAAGSATDSRDEILVREFLRTYLVVIGVQAIIAYMVFGGLLLKPGGKAPVEPGAAFVTWQFWAVVAGLVLMRAAVYWWDFVRGGEASVIPPEAAVAEPLRRLFVLQFGVLAGALLIYWFLDSSVTALAVLLIAKTAADVILAVLERLRAARIEAAVAAGIAPRGRSMTGPKQRARRGGRKRRR
jgi:Family of unknown function (DUF6498)